ncbi:uncharacterized protein LOC117783941 isoform X2 [Drosophila innubila]|uniref:uncharacterized protein LOC117783941 isoform X2 n=1 Tax=Drosophila innubila TaxID=198719 RepID=UPI00148DC7A6|nr:uncharacterized protein LOC117783941 isoform X2 [Drosophila innubila]
MEENGMLSYVKEVIHALVNSTPQRMTVEGLKRDYLGAEGSAVPYNKFGFKTVESFLHSISDTVEVIGCGPMAEVVAKQRAKSAHIQKLVKSQKKPSANARSRKRQKSRFVYPSERSDLVFINEHHNSSRRFNNNDNNYSYANRKPQQYSGNRLPSRNNYYGQYSRQEYRPTAYSQQRMIETTNSNSVETSIANLKIANVDEDSSSSSDGFKIYLPDRATLSKPIEIKSNSPIHLDNNANPTSKKSTVDSPIDYVSSEDSCDEQAFPTYAVEERVDLVTKKPPIVPQAKNPMMEPLNGYLSSDAGSDSEAIPAYADHRVIGMAYPKDAVRFDQVLPDNKIHKKMKLDSRLAVQLVTVASPHSFYFWTLDDDFVEYKAMSSNMQSYYDNIDHKKYTIPMVLIMSGHLAACTNMNMNWQRVRVLDIKTGSAKNIEVEYVDTGERMWVCHGDLKYLSTEFAKLPAQCWSGRLSCIMPMQGTHFSLDASNYFYKLVSHRRLYAKIEKINDTNNTVHMILVDPNAVTYSKNINIELVESGLVRRSYSP